MNKEEQESLLSASAIGRLLLDPTFDRILYSTFLIILFVFLFNLWKHEKDYEHHEQHNIDIVQQVFHARVHFGALVLSE